MLMRAAGIHVIARCFMGMCIVEFAMEVVDTLSEQYMDEGSSHLELSPKPVVRRFESGGARAVGRWTSHDIRIQARGRIASDKG
jgi:hypothetical protein